MSDEKTQELGLSALERLPSLRLAVVGDSMLDRFVRGRVDRISPEAPVPVVHVHHEEERLGGAANVAANLAALGTNAHLFSLCGRDDAAERLDALLSSAGIDASGLVRSRTRPTTLKTRILAGSQQIVRIDRESTGKIVDEDWKALLSALRAAGPFEAVVVSDYGKGVVGEELMALMRSWRGEGRLIVVDPKQGNFELYRGVSAITPNEREAGAACHDSIEDEADAARVGGILLERLKTDLILITRGEKGICLLESGRPIDHVPADARQVYDVTGAGDTVIATFTAILASGASPLLATRMANAAAGVAVASLGTTAVDRASLEAAWTRRKGGC
jgi:rfaE bifunctional protein kinase chain/domain